MYFRRILIILLAWLIFPLSGGAISLDDGVAAYNDGNYLTAKKIFQELAEQGVVVSQRYLAEMYDKGRGVRRDYDKAVHWYKKAAKQSDSRAQYLLGVKYVNGHGVPLDRKLAYAWFAIAFNNGYEKAADPIKVLNQSMPLEERQEALKLASEKLTDLP